MRERLKKTMPSKAHHEILTAVGSICTQNLLLPIALVITVVGAVVTALVPPLILEKIVDGLTAGNPMPIAQAFSYLGVVALAGLLESTRESLLIVFGQKLTHGLRSQMCEKLSQLAADTLSKMDPGTIASRFVGDVDTLETLFTSGIISMFADACTMIGIYAVLWQKNRGLAITLLAILPLIALFTRHVQKKMLAAQMDSRKAAARTSGLVPEAIHCIRMIHVFGKEGFMRKRYDRTLQEGYAAMERTNFYDALYSPVILITDALVTGIVMLLSASSGPEVRMFFGCGNFLYFENLFPNRKHWHGNPDDPGGAGRCEACRRISGAADAAGNLRGGGRKSDDRAWQSQRRHGFAGRMHFSGRRQLRL